jgi:hypothetical protein
MASRNRDQDGEPELAFHQCGDRRPLRRADEEITFPVPGLPPGLGRDPPLVDRFHGRGLFERTAQVRPRPRLCR